VKIHQFNVGYLADQDRVLVRVNTSTGLEFRLWFTRRLTIGLLPLLRKVSAEQVQRHLAVAPQNASLAAKDPKVREMLGEFEKEQVLQQADFKTPYKAPDPASLAQEPLLVTEVQVKPLANGQVEMNFGAKLLAPGKKPELKIALDHQLMHGLLHLLEKTFAESRWGQGVLADDDADTATLEPAASRPQYLN
jgi:hypothetical protein